MKFENEYITCFMLFRRENWSWKCSFFWIVRSSGLKPGISGGGGGDLLLQAGIMNTEALGVFIWAKTCILTMLRTFLFIRFDFHDENVWFFHEILVISFSYKRKSWRHWCLIAFKGGILWICLHYRHGPDMFVKIAGFNSACTFPPIYSHIIVRNILS